MEQGSKILQFSSACWEDVFKKIPGAAVYIDHAAAECLHWFKGDRGYLELIQAGAHSVHELTMFTFQYVKVQGTAKVVIIITSPDAGFYQKTLHTIIEKNTFESCTIICAVHGSILNYMKVGSYDKLKENIFLRMKDNNPNKKLSVEVLYRPIFIAPITENIFVTPAMEKLMPPIDGKVIDEHETSINYFISSLHSIFTHLNVNEDIYSLGEFSKYVAEKLENFPPAIDRRNMRIGRSGVSLILIDRTLDLCTATKTNTECVLSRILCTLPHLPYHNNDVAVNMTSLCPDLEDSPLSMTVPGCIATNDYQNINLLIAKKQKDVLLTFNKWLFEMSSSELQSPKAKMSTRVTAHTLEKLVHKVRDNESPKSLAKNSKKLQLILAVIQSLKSEKTAQLDLIISLEKLILQNLAVSRESTTVLAQISNIIKSRIAKGLNMENLLVLLVHIYAITGTEIKFSAQQEEQLKTALADAIFEDILKCNDNSNSHEVSVYQQTLLLLGVTDESTAKTSAQKLTEQIMNTLHAIASQRKNLENYRSMITKPSPQEMAECTSLVERLVCDLVHPSEPMPHDLKQKNSSLISTGFNLLTKGRTQQHPTDNPWIIIYILGGITAEETRIVEELSQTCDIPRITLAGCRLLNPTNTADKVLLSNLNI